MKRKITSVIIALVMALTVISPVAFAAGEGLITFRASSTNVSRGDTLRYVISLADSDPARGFQAGISYDADKADLIDAYFISQAEEDAVSAEIITSTEGQVGLVLAFDEAAELTGDVAAVEFKIKEDAASGPANFGLTPNGVEITSADNEVMNIAVSFDNVSINYDYTASLTAAASADTVYNNSELTYTLNLSGLEGMRGVSFALNYDSELLTLTSADAKGALAEDTYYNTVIDTSSEGNIYVTAEYEEPTYIGGDILEVKFKVNPGMSSGSYAPLGLASFEAVTGNKEIADLDLTFKADAVTVSRSSYIKMSYVTDKKEAQIGEYFTYTVTLDQIAASRGFQAEFIYDSDKLDLVSVQKGEILNDADRISGIVTDVEGKVDFVCAYEDEAQYTGVVAVLTFVVKENAADGYVNVNALSPLAVDDNYEYIDSEGINSIDRIYIGRLARKYDIALSTDKDFYKAGETLYLTADMGEIENFLGVQFDIRFNPDKLQYIKPSKASAYYGDVLKAASAKKINAVKAAEGKLEVLMGFGTSEAYSGNGKICTIAFVTSTDISTYEDIIIDTIIPNDGDTIIGENTRVYISANGVVNNTVTAINSIGSVEESDETIIRNARALYDSLTEEEKQQVENYDILVNSEAALIAVKAINAIGTVTLDSYAAISKARKEYDSLSIKAKVLVSNYVVLQAAEQKYTDLLPYYEYSCTEKDGNILINVKNNKYSGSPDMIIAQYAADGRMLSCEIKKLSIMPGNSATLEYTKNAATDTVKVFIWKSTQTMIPIK